MASSTTFVLNILLARWLLPREYGAYSVCWSVLMVLAGFHNALILEPMTIVGPAEYGNQIDAYLHVNDRLNWLVILSAASIAVVVALAYHQSAVHSSGYALAVCAVGYLLLLVARRKQYVMNRPVRALFLSLIYSIVVFVLIYVCRRSGHLSVNTALITIGLAGLAGLRILSKTAGHPLCIWHIAREHWRYGKWLFASSLLAMGATDVQTILLSMLVDLRSAGALRALLNFVLPLWQLITILSIYALPRLSARAKQWGTPLLLKKAILFPALVTAVTAVYLALLLFFAPQLEHLLYNGKMQSYLSWLPLLAASALVTGVGASFSALLRSVQNSQHQFIAAVTSSAVGIVCALFLLRRMGIAGALWSMLAANLAGTSIIIATYLWLLRQRRNA